MNSALKYFDVGESPKYAVADSPTPPAKYYPKVSLDLKDFPGIADAGIGAEVEIVFRAKICGLSAYDDVSSANLELIEGALSDVKPGTKVTLTPAVKTAIKNEADSALETLIGSKGRGAY